MRLHILVATFLASVLLTSCETTKDTPENKTKVAQIPTNYRELTVAYFKATLKDPYSVRDAQITDPTVIFVGLVNGTSAPGVCVKMNAKNSFGAYTGAQSTSVSFKNGAVFVVGPPLFDTCTKSIWRPFPEMNGTG